MTPKLLQNRGANEATPTQCFLHLSRNPSNKTTFACGWPPLGDPAVILWASRTHTLQDAGRAEQQLPFSRIWALVGSVWQFDIFNLTSQLEQISACFPRDQEQRWELQSTYRYTHTGVRRAESCSTYSLQPAPRQGLGSGAQQGAGGSP